MQETNMKQAAEERDGFNVKKFCKYVKKGNSF
jgi:hypothetical protein